VGGKRFTINNKKRRTVASPNTKKTVLKNVNLSITPILSLLSLNIGMKLQEEMGENGHQHASSVRNEIRTCMCNFSPTGFAVNILSIVQFLFKSR